MSVRMTSSLEFSGAPPPGNRRAGSCMGGLVDLTNADGQGDRGSVGLNETHRHAGCFGRGARDSREELMRIFGPEPLFRDRRDAGPALAARLGRYRGLDPLVLRLPRRGSVVDAGRAAGATLRAAVRSVRKQSPARLVVAVPVGSREACEALRAEADEVVCLHAPASFSAVGSYYLRFDQASDDEVRRLLQGFTPGAILPYAR